jgi:hypothetical protein
MEGICPCISVDQNGAKLRGELLGLLQFTENTLCFLEGTTGHF